MNRSVVILRNVGHGVNDIFWYILPSLLPVILDQFGMKYGTAGGLLTAFLGVVAVFSFILGKISDYFPRHIIIGAGFLVASLFLIGGSLTNNFNLFVACLLVAGIGVGSYHAAGYALIEDITENRKGRAYGMFEFWGAAGVLLMFLLHGLLLNHLSWRNIILITSIPGLAMGFLYFIYSERFRSAADRAKGKILNKTEIQDAPVLLFILFIISFTIRYFGILGVVSFTSTYLVRELGLQANVASYATGIYFLGGLIFTPFMGMQCDIRNPILVLLFTTLIPFPLIFLMTLTQPLWVLPVYLLLIGGSYYGAGPAMSMIIARMSSKLGKGEAFGYFMAVTSVTFSISPLLFGMLADRIGLNLTMKIYSLPLLLGSVVLLVLFVVEKRYCLFEGTTTVR
ncbi:hypothetical protein LCGC14_2139610 [marine sediment metagenome]|uniref:Major facilitator superfamily (MFS) profile domain-containing protein n=1 Tax=marine sediment metagenome TaxID=412755 RepID=A0A0F9DZ11_9ZZZZ